MFHPVGSQQPSVYWRRRLTLLASILALLTLIGITVRVLTAKDGTSSAAGAANSSSKSAARRPTPTNSSSLAHTPSRPPSSTTPSKSSGTAPSSSKHLAANSASNTAAARCKVPTLGLVAASDKTKYPANAQPKLSILVTNTGSAPCVQDLADPQIVLQVYNGESRVWGSHDCKIIPGKNNETLMAKQTVRVTVDWSGLSSEKNCTGTRQRVGSGTYTLHAALSGRNGKTVQFSIV